MAVALLITLVAIIDISHARLHGRAPVAVGLAAIIVSFVVQVSLSDAAVWLAFAMLGGAAGWFALRIWFGADVAAVWLAAAAAAGIAVDDSAVGTATKVVAVVGVALFLTHPANEVCRTVLERARVPHELPPSQVEGEDAVDAAEDTLRGGRFIGPLERWSVTVLALVGAQAVIVGLMAAKGIGRYPELAGDKGHSSKAEEFLIGSLVSWLVAAAAAAYLFVTL